MISKKICCRYLSEALEKYDGKNHYDCVWKFLNNTKDINKEWMSETFLNLALRKNFPVNIIEIMLKKGANPNFKNPLGLAMTKHDSYVKLLLEYGAIPLFKIKKKKTYTSKEILIKDYMFFRNLRLALCLIREFKPKSLIGKNYLCKDMFNELMKEIPNKKY